MEPKTKKVEKRKETKRQKSVRYTCMLRSIGKQSGESMESVYIVCLSMSVCPLAYPQNDERKTIYKINSKLQHFYTLSHEKKFELKKEQNIHFSFFHKKSQLLCILHTNFTCVV